MSRESAEPVRVAIIDTATTGKALFVPLNGDSISTLKNKFAINRAKELRALGFIVHVQQAKDKSGIYVWATKRDE